MHINNCTTKKELNQIEKDHPEFDKKYIERKRKTLEK
jgi:3-methyladenine DNA glycosylase AlkC